MLVAALLCIATCAHADPFDDAKTAYKNGDIATALRIWGELGENGDPSAAYNMGMAYLKGIGVGADPKTAADWFRKAAEGGHPWAQRNLGLMYASGTGLPLDRVKGLMWLTIAADSGAKDAAQARDLMAGELKPGEVAEAQRLAQEWEAKKP
jgi:TPR repeat protein